MYKESLLLKLSFEQQLLLITKLILSLLDIKSFFITIRFKALITITKVLLQVVTKFIFVNRNNNAKVYECVEININLRYKINYYLRISTKVLHLVKLVIFEES